jgi:hypothetical protein
MRVDWAALPEAVMAGITDRVGGGHAVSAGAGDHAEFAATVGGSGGKVFVKASRTDFGVRALRYELLVSEAVDQTFSPAVEWHFVAAGWLVVGFEHCDGPHADLSPGSTDLDLLDAALRELAETPAPDVPLFTPKGRLGFAHPTMDGASLIHTDLGPANLIVTAGGLRIVDWAFATRAAPWLELVLLVPWLIGSGHTPERAEAWTARFPAWGDIPAGVLDGFVSDNAAKWASKAGQNPSAWVHDLAGWTSRWAAHRRRERRPT